MMKSVASFSLVCNIWLVAMKDKEKAADFVPSIGQQCVLPFGNATKIFSQENLVFCLNDVPLQFTKGSGSWNKQCGSDGMYDIDSEDDE